MLPALVAEGVCKSFDARTVLRDVSFSLPFGSFLTIFGPNGAGKTTLLRILSTLARPTSGAVSILGRDSVREAQAVRGEVGLISHAPMLYPDLTAYENLVFFGRLYGVADPAARADVLLRAVELEGRKYDAVRTFSRGMTQRLSIARAFVNDPRILLLDEPYAGLDPHAVGVLDALLAEHRVNRTFVMVSHDFDHGYELCSHVLLIGRGAGARFLRKDEVPLDELRCEYEATLAKGAW